MLVKGETGRPYSKGHEGDVTTTWDLGTPKQVPMINAFGVVTNQRL